MVRRNGRYVIRRDNNVLEVDFSREPDPPAPRFPGASGIRDSAEGDSEPGESLGEFSWALANRASSLPIWLPGAGGRPPGGRRFNNRHVA
jgi:hypothetical protein